MIPWRDPVWKKSNQEYLQARMEVILAAFEARSQRSETKSDKIFETAAGKAAGKRALEIATGMSSPPALDMLTMRFGLSSFESNVVVALASLELTGPMADFARKQNPDGVPRLTFSGLFGSLQEAHWSSTGPESPLRYWRMFESSSDSFSVHSLVRLDESILHFLAGNP